jgi:fatty acid desaturase
LNNCSTTAHRAHGRDARGWTQLLTRYREPSHARSIVEIAITLGALTALWVLAWAACYFGYQWLTLLLALPAAGFLVRLFAIQHDCGHGALFRHRLANDWVGRVIGVVTLTPYDFWRQAHAIHHATSGHLDRRGVGDIDTLTHTRKNTYRQTLRNRRRTCGHIRDQRANEKTPRCSKCGEKDTTSKRAPLNWLVHNDKEGDRVAPSPCRKCESHL